ncbi:MAG: aminoacyl-tRNA hydrolase [Bacillota bacterium]
MKLITGLGNPGDKYEDTRHNVGFRAIKNISENYDFEPPVLELNALVSSGKIENEKVILTQPLSYMNKSGKVVKNLINYYNVSNKDLIIIYDDLDLDPGTIRIKTHGSSGGHNGIKSIINWLNTKKVPRIRIGIGRPKSDIEIVDYVLGRFSKQEEVEINQAVKNVVKAVKIICKNGFEQAMSCFN